MHKLHIRLLDTKGDLLGWTEIYAFAKGDGQLWVQDPVTVLPDQIGICAAVSVHWVDLNVEIRTPVLETRVDRVVTLFPPGPIFRVGPQAGGLPPVTVRGSIGIPIPAGAWGTRGLV